MFDDLIKKQAVDLKRESIKQAKPISSGTVNLRADKFIEKLPKPKAIAPPPPVVTGFEQRIEKLRTKGKKRGQRYSVIGISASIVICLFVLAGGYYLLTEVIDLSERVDDGDNNQIDYLAVSDNKCDDDCCLASYKKIKNNNYEDFNEISGCTDGYTMNQLECETSLKWCEPVECTEEGKIFSQEPGSEGPTCCADLTQAVSYIINDDECEQPLEDGAVCIACPNGVCGLGETECNCPEDCDIFGKTSKTTYEIISTSTEDWQTYRNEEYGADGLIAEEDIAATSTPAADDDNDGLTNIEEAEYGTDPNEPDTDGDGFFDGEEVKNGYNPLGEGSL